LQASKYPGGDKGKKQKQRKRGNFAFGVSWLLQAYNKTGISVYLTPLDNIASGFSSL